MKRYGHKNTGLVYIEGTDNLYYWRNNGKFDQSIPKEIIENSNDWQLLSPKFLFKTIDGVEYMSIGFNVQGSAKEDIVAIFDKIITTVRKLM